MRLQTIYVGLLAALFSVAAQGANLVPAKIESGNTGSGLQVEVRDAVGALSGADVWIETPAGKSIAEGSADKDGLFQAALSDADLAAGVTVTAAATGHGAVSVVGATGHKVSFTLAPTPLNEYPIFKGKMSGFPAKTNDRDLQVGIVAKALRIDDLAQLDVGSLISPLKDSIDVFGKRELPSNLVLPDQNVRYFLSIHVQKDFFRLPVLAGSSDRYFAVSGNLPVDQLVGGMPKADSPEASKAKNSWELLNAVDFTTVGVTDPVAVPASAKTGAEIPLNVSAPNPLKEQLILKNSGRGASAEKLKHLVAALWEFAPGVFAPTDLKLVKDRDMILDVREAKKARAMDLWIATGNENKLDQHFSGAWLPAGATSVPDQGFTGELTLNGWEKAWEVRGGDAAKVLVAHVENRLTTPMGTDNVHAVWTVVSPGKSRLELPALALQNLKARLGTVSSLSVDLLQVGSGGYPFLEGEVAAGALTNLERIRRAVR